MLAQDAVELSDEGARLLAEGCRPFRGPDGQHMTPAQCTVANVDILARFWLVRCTLRGPNLMLSAHNMRSCCPVVFAVTLMPSTRAIWVNANGR